MPRELDLNIFKLLEKPLASTKQDGHNANLYFALIMIMMMPILPVYLLVQPYFTAGLTLGSVKE